MTNKQYFRLCIKNAHNEKAGIFSCHSQTSNNGALSIKYSQESGNDSPIYEMLI